MLETVKIFAVDLEIGMYVAGLDRSWLETPFSVQGFCIETDEQISRLRGFCEYVYVDCKSSTIDPAIIRRKVRSRPRKSRQQLFVGRTLKPYADKSSLVEECSTAGTVLDNLSETIANIYGNISAGGSLNLVRVKKSMEPLIASITRNPDACLWLARMKQHDEYTYQHSLGVSIWSVALGRQLGLPKSDLRTLALGGLLLDVGKLRLDPKLLQESRVLTDDERKIVMGHVTLGVDMLKSSGLMNQEVIDMVACHHERYDGSGYPAGLNGDKIPIFARIAAIADCYDAITTQRAYARAIPPSSAIKLLYDWRDVDFQAELVEEFIQMVGMYPAGTLVELSSGEVAVVVAEHRNRRLKPRVLLLLGADKQPLAEKKMLDLLAYNEAVNKSPLKIVDSLESDAYGIDLAQVDYQKLA